ncbi:unnamed protein product [Acanthoscelides obtectus]|uniref:Uncharacterized protein n=1 Tax=Acanthoscelides obtectus TaxID=200917 RepID=A0A9P0JXN9_ACAOB|nr:unnamed protein product [Acanthoscelides obtectus]CAH2017952.1 unnamed protein product [Acanthoscelides obtectus]CAK1623791.1 hypothetical protein AOBTE_LOCUS2185 [Acanthoscelides obtectus]CAK1623936.1 hypothetical protein AOBTE_LOCUS2239 [Acanthoscelides obtectus]
MKNTVTFNEENNNVCVARQSTWETEVVVRCRFHQRLLLVEEMLKSYLTVEYRQKVFKERFEV